MPRYSSKAARAIAFLKRPYNDVDIYVEDTANHNMWFVLIKHLLPPEVRLTSINLLGGRESVVSACKLDQINIGRPRLYIIDADFDHLLGRRKPRLRFLYRIRAYCIENLLANQTALESLAQICRPELNARQLSKRIDLQALISNIYARLRNLFQVYAAAECLGVGVQTVGKSVQSLYINLSSGIDLCDKKIRRRIYEVVRETCRKVGAKIFFSKLHRIRHRATKLSPELWISGKDYVLPIVFINMQKALNLRSDIEQLKVQLANFWYAQNEPFLARRIRVLIA